MKKQITVTDIQQRLRTCTSEEFAVLQRSLAADTRITVLEALDAARRRLARQKAEQDRLDALYLFERSISGGVTVGLDEVGRGPVAGPLAIGAVVLPDTPRIPYLNDSKKIAPAKRSEIAKQIEAVALAHTVVYVEASRIDAIGMSAALREGFAGAIQAIDASGLGVTCVLVDGNPIRIDEREHNVIKGDAKCASIAAASIIAKVARDLLMDEYDAQYPAYGFARNKGYASAEHIEAIRTHGLSPIHRASFCSGFLQESLF